MTDGQIKALFTILEYTAKMVVELRSDQRLLREGLQKLREAKRQSLVNLRASNARLRAERDRLAAEVKTLHSLLSDQL